MKTRPLMDSLKRAERRVLMDIASAMVKEDTDLTETLQAVHAHLIAAKFLVRAVGGEVQAYRAAVEGEQSTPAQDNIRRMQESMSMGQRPRDRSHTNNGVSLNPPPDAPC